MSKRSLEYLDLPLPVKRAKITPKTLDIFSPTSPPGTVKFTPDGTSYREIPLMLPLSLPINRTRNFQALKSLPYHNWNNIFLQKPSQEMHQMSVNAISATVQAITIEDRAIARFSGYIGHSRLIPFDYHRLPRSQQWISPVPFTKQELSVSATNRPLYIDYKCIKGAYFPEGYHGIRQSFIIDPTFNVWYRVQRGTKIVLGSVIGDRVAYFATRIRFIFDKTAGIEVVGITEDGYFHDDTSLSWPPIILEVSLDTVDKPSFGDWVPSVNDSIVPQ